MVVGSPEGMGFCHCTSCRSWSAAPLTAFTLWKPANVKLTGGKLATYSKTEASHRQFCPACGGHVMTVHPGFDLIDVYASTIPELSFIPELHVHYQEAVLRLADGLPKFRDLPQELGGSGETIS
jgi:hypothetical protein